MLRGYPAGGWGRPGILMPPAACPPCMGLIFIGVKPPLEAIFWIHKWFKRDGNFDAEFRSRRVRHLLLASSSGLNIANRQLEEIALLDGPVDLEAKTQACILQQVRQDVLR
ncbi:hypothetical protein EYF80_024461 [Liparis tanakae]|uniref:Uncharacterized protein n=1 Tax=Liparis tanakae TaxID=230148 RepID=A0A4Z2HHJ2_9TELE|nr:hypothetical protein EYF80_024461 [Liparis tanakae]